MNEKFNEKKKLFPKEVKTEKGVVGGVHVKIKR